MSTTTTFDVIRLATGFASMDPVEGNFTLENLESLVGVTFGSPSQPLWRNIAELSLHQTAVFERYNVNNTAVPNGGDTFRLSDVGVRTFDAVKGYRVTITYDSGSTTQTLIVVVQDTQGDLYLFPQLDNNQYQAALTAAPIASITVNSALSGSFTQFIAARQPTNLLVCFAGGTRLSTPRGPVPVEALRIGDLVLTADRGPQPILWRNRQHLGPAALDRRPEARAIVVPAGVLGATRPVRVSPQHCLLLPNGCFARAKHLAGLGGVMIDDKMREVTYWHFLLDRHSVLDSDGLASESYYPGPVGMRGLAPGPRARLDAILAERFGPFGRLLPSAVYGPPARPILPRAEARAAFAAALGLDAAA